MSFLINPYIYATGGGSFVNDYSMLFDGVNEYFSCPDDASLDITDNLSVFAWVKSTDTVGYISNKGVTNVSYILRLENSGRLRCQVSTDGTATASTWKNYEYTTAINDGNWHFVGFTFASGTFKIYVDGSDVTASCTKYTDPSITTINTNSNSLYINYFNTSYNGYIDEVSIWDTTVLSGADISTLYNSGAPTDLSAYAGSANLVSWWRMGDGATWGGSSWSVPDEVGSNDLTSTNMEEADRSTDVPT